MCPGHPLLDAVIDLTLERHRDLPRRGAVLVDERDSGSSPRLLVYLEHAIQDAAAARARAIIMEVERQLGFDPVDREFEKLGYDIESRILE